MPNWCENHLTIEGRRDEVARFVAQARTEDEALQFGRFIPEPDGLVDPNEDRASWYEWRIENWGTKWELEEVDSEEADQVVDDENPELATYFFDTAWDPPIAFVATISTQFPALTFILSYDEPTMGFGGAIRLRDGQMNTLAEGHSRSEQWDENDEPIEFVQTWHDAARRLENIYDTTNERIAPARYGSAFPYDLLSCMARVWAFADWLVETENGDDLPDDRAEPLEATKKLIIEWGRDRFGQKNGGTELPDNLLMDSLTCPTAYANAWSWLHGSDELHRVVEFCVQVAEGNEEIADCEGGCLERNDHVANIVELTPYEESLLTS